MNVVTTALSILLVNEIELNFVNEIRSKYDKSFLRWMPHINLLFPFVNEEQFDKVINILQPILLNIDSFNINMNEIGYFSQGKDKITVHIKSSNDDKLQELYNIICLNLPQELKELITAKHYHKFNPHLTIGQFSKSNKLSTLNELKLWLGDGFILKIDKISILQRSKINIKEPFHIEKEIFLKL